MPSARGVKAKSGDTLHHPHAAASYGFPVACAGAGFENNKVAHLIAFWHHKGNPEQRPEDDQQQNDCNPASW